MDECRFFVLFFFILLIFSIVFSHSLQCTAVALRNLLLSRKLQRCWHLAYGLFHHLFLFLSLSPSVSLVVILVSVHKQDNGRSISV
jgi:hypothetical protein